MHYAFSEATVVVYEYQASLKVVQGGLFLVASSRAHSTSRVDILCCVDSNHPHKCTYLSMLIHVHVYYIVTVNPDHQKVELTCYSTCDACDLL